MLIPLKAPSPNKLLPVVDITENNGLPDDINSSLKFVVSMLSISIDLNTYREDVSSLIMASSLSYTVKVPT